MLEFPSPCTCSERDSKNKGRLKGPYLTYLLVQPRGGGDGGSEGEGDGLPPMLQVLDDGEFLGSPYRGNTWSIGLQCNRHQLSEMMESEASRAAMQSASTE